MMEALAMFAAHAPETIPLWYREAYEATDPAPARPRHCPEDAAKVLGRELSYEERGLIENWLDDPCYDLEGDLAAFQQACDDEHAEREGECLDHEERLYFSWRIYYARRMASLMAGEGGDIEMPEEQVFAIEPRRGDDALNARVLQQLGFPSPAEAA